MSDEFKLLPWVFAAIGTIVGTLATVVSMLYKREMNGFDIREKKMQVEIDSLREKVGHCEKEHTEARLALARLEVRLELIEGKLG